MLKQAAHFANLERIHKIKTARILKMTLITRTAFKISTETIKKKYYSLRSSIKF